MVGRNAVHFLGLLRHTTEKIPAPDYDRNLNSQRMDIGQFRSDGMYVLWVNPETLVRGERLSGELQQDALEHGDVGHVSFSLPVLSSKAERKKGHHWCH